MTEMQTLLLKATNLIKSQSNNSDETDLVTQINKSDDQESFCKLLESQISSLAENGKTEEIGIRVRALEKSNFTPNIRKILHYFAQSESERGKNILWNADKEELLKVLKNISEAFRLANSLDLVAPI